MRGQFFYVEIEPTSDMKHMEVEKVQLSDSNLLCMLHYQKIETNNYLRAIILSIRLHNSKSCFVSVRKRFHIVEKRRVKIV